MGVGPAVASSDGIILPIKSVEVDELEQTVVLKLLGLMSGVIPECRTFTHRIFNRSDLYHPGHLPTFSNIIITNDKINLQKIDVMLNLKFFSVEMKMFVN